MRKLCYCLLAALLLSVVACGKYEKNPVSATSGTAVIFCDNSFENIMEQEIDVFEYIYFPNVHILCQYGNEAEGLDSFFAGNIRTIVIPRDLTDAEKAKVNKKQHNLRSSRIAVDAMALIVNPDNPVTKLSLKEVGQIISGDTKSWYDIDPSFPDKPIAILFDNAGSSMLKYMRDSLTNGQPLGPNVYAQGSIQGVIDAVKKDKSAIGVIGVSWLTSDLQAVFNAEDEIDTLRVSALAKEISGDTASIDMPDINARLDSSGVKVVALMRNDDPRAYKPYQQNIYNGTYPLTRSIFMITTAHPSTPAGGLYSFITSVKGQALIMKTGIMPARMQVNIVELMP